AIRQQRAPGRVHRVRTPPWAGAMKAQLSNSQITIPTARRAEVVHVGRQVVHLSFLLTRRPDARNFNSLSRGEGTPLLHARPMVHVERFKLFARWATARKHSLPGRWVRNARPARDSPRRREAAGGH